MEQKEEYTMETMERTSTSKESTVRQILDLAAFVASVLARLSFEQVKFLLGNKDTVLRKKLQEVFEIAGERCVDVYEEWQDFYRQHFNMIVDFSGVQIPEKPTEGSWRLLFIPVGLSMHTTLAVMRTKFKVWTYIEDLDASVTKNTRTSATSYAIWVRDGVEPDEKYLGKSTREADMDGNIGVTLLERLVFEVKFFVETGNHLDIKGVTFCTGSRNSDGNVPYVYFDPSTGEVCVSWCRVDDAGGAYGLRQAVSL
jgi:hypothetical protein